MGYNHNSKWAYLPIKAQPKSAAHNDPFPQAPISRSQRLKNGACSYRGDNLTPASASTP
jgi:hypothetical protein